MSGASIEAPATLLDRPHHDGSDAYVLERPDELGGSATVRLRVPRGTHVDDVALRAVRDGEPRLVRAELDEETETDSWYRATFTVDNPTTRYRWLLAGGTVGYAWVNGLDVIPHDVADADDFVLTTDPGGPDWHLGSVAYEIFPDRFASSGTDAAPPAWAVLRGWDDLPTGRGKETPFELYGGDLGGIEARLEHVERLGADLLYLTPFFPAGSTHRYDASSFEHVDALLGGDEALRSLVRAAHARGMRVVGDLTLNHSGKGHEWFAGERDFYYFDESAPGGYASWLGIGSLPKLNWGSALLRERMQDVAKRWLEVGLDGWRIDVANMTGRHRDVRPRARRGSRDPERARARPRADRGARPRLPRRPRGRRVARDDELRRFPAAGVAVAARRRAPGGAPALLLGHAGRAAAARWAGGDSDDADVPRRGPVAVDPPFVEPARQPRHRTLPHRGRLT